MFRTLIFLAILAMFVAGGVWFADHPGIVQVQWQGYQVETSFAVLLSGIAVVAAVVAVVYRFWGFIRKAPGKISEVWENRRRRQGYQALTHGMVAVAAGDGFEASKQVKRARGLLNEPPLTMLLSAQTAQLNGDEEAAAKFFQAMTETPEMEFLGIRGLLNQAEKRGDSKQALELARRAYRLRPKSEWVSKQLFDLQSRQQQWLDAKVTSDQLLKSRLISPDEGRRRKTVLLYQMGMQAQSIGDEANALKHFKASCDQCPDFIPSAVALAGQWIRQGKHRKAVAVIEKGWRLSPHPSMLETYWQAKQIRDELTKVKAAEALVKNNPGHIESHLAIAQAALEARLWGEARRHLSAAEAASENVSSRVCRLWADLEETEHQNAEAARLWLIKATRAVPDSQWICVTCGNAVVNWSVICGKCGEFDKFSWQTPSHITGLPGGQPEILPEILSGALPEIVPDVSEVEIKTGQIPPLKADASSVKITNATIVHKPEDDAILPASKSGA